jgi:transcriptional regulator with XRE-family HTH domain
LNDEFWEADNLSKWSQKLDAYLAMTNISKKQLALELGISINTLGKWWRGREPSTEHATKIRQLLHENNALTMTASVKYSASTGRETASDEVVARQLPREFSKHGDQSEDRSVIVSLLRTICPFCAHTVNRFQNCAYCGQHLVWANVPIDKS